MGLPAGRGQGCRVSAVRGPGPSLPQSPVGSERAGPSRLLVTGCCAGAGVGRLRGSGSPQPQESGAERPYKDMCAGRQSAAGAGRRVRVPRRLACQPGRPSVPSRPFQSLPAAPRPPAMSSTQFNKGPSYGLSAEVKNRVSEGRTPAPPAQPVAPSAAAGRATRRIPSVGGGPPS